MITPDQADMLKSLLRLIRARAPFGMDDIDSDYLAERLWMNLDTSRRMVCSNSYFSNVVIDESFDAIDLLIQHHQYDMERVMELRSIALGYRPLRSEREEQAVTPRMVRDLAVFARVGAMFSTSRKASGADPQALSDALGEARKLIDANSTMTDDPFLGVLVTEAGKAAATLEGL